MHPFTAAYPALAVGWQCALTRAVYSFARRVCFVYGRAFSCSIWT